MLIGDSMSSYRIIFGCYNWEVTLGRFCINFYDLMIGRYNATPISGYISCDIRICWYLKHHMNFRIICYTRFVNNHGDVVL